MLKLKRSHVSIGKITTRREWTNRLRLRHLTGRSELWRSQVTYWLIVEYGLNFLHVPEVWLLLSAFCFVMDQQLYTSQRRKLRLHFLRTRAVESSGASLLKASSETRGETLLRANLQTRIKFWSCFTKCTAKKFPALYSLFSNNFLKDNGSYQWVTKWKVWKGM